MHEVQDRFLVTEQGTISFAKPIRQAIEINGVIIVRLGLVGRADSGDNVYGVENGQIIWRVQDKVLYNPNYADPNLPQQDPYTLIGPLEGSDNLFWGTTGYGDCFRIDSQTGKIVGYKGWFK